jgi:hypothetical protein
MGYDGFNRPVHILRIMYIMLNIKLGPLGERFCWYYITLFPALSTN